MDSKINSDGGPERFTIVMDDDGLPVIRTATGIIASTLVKEIEAFGE